MLVAIGLVVLGYLLGSVASAIVVSRAMRLPDPRTDGSGNPGATNVLRIGGKKAALLTLLGDVLKGLLPVLLARGLDQPAGVIALVALAAFIGHLYPIYFRFRGGKGVATALGGLSGIAWWLGAAVLATWLAVAALTRYSSLAALAAALAAPAYALWLTGDPAFTAATAAMGIALVWRHRDNIRHLREGTEDKIGSKRRQGSANPDPDPTE